VFGIFAVLSDLKHRVGECLIPSIGTLWNQGSIESKVGKVRSRPTKRKYGSWGHSSLPVFPALRDLQEGNVFITFKKVAFAKCATFAGMVRAPSKFISDAKNRV
jgi:hypothetical protein